MLPNRWTKNAEFRGRIGVLNDGSRLRPATVLAIGRVIAQSPDVSRACRRARAMALVGPAATPSPRASDGHVVELGVAVPLMLAETGERANIQNEIHGRAKRSQRDCGRPCETNPTALRNEPKLGSAREGLDGRAFKLLIHRLYG
jgi:hypothetical protein